MDKLRWDRDFALEQAAEDIELLEELLEIFKESCVNDYRILEEGVSAKDAEKICGAAHSIKGASASLGIEGIRDIALRIEEDSRAGSIQVAKDLLPDLDELLKLFQNV